jgi:hypothetical protein
MDSTGNELNSPTPHPGVNAVLRDFATHIQSILGSHFLGLYLCGSLALGDFDPSTSDIDFIVVTDVDISDNFFIPLQEMHAQFDRSHSPWARKVEAAYIPGDALNHSAPTAATYLQVEKGTSLFRAPLEIGWAFQRHTLREHAIAVTGPELRSLIYPVRLADMQHAASVILRDWLEQSRHDASWRRWAQIRSNQAFVILTLCRLLYSLETGSVASKLVAARYAQKNFEARWNILIEQALAGQHSNQETPEEDFRAMLALLSYTLERSQPSQ